MARCFDTPCPRCGKTDSWGEFPSGTIVVKDAGYYKIEISTCCPGRTFLKDENKDRVKAAAVARGWTKITIDACFQDEACPCGITRQDCDYHK